MTATEKQINYLSFLAKKAGFATYIGAMHEYFGTTQARLNVREASELIDALKNGEIAA